jgi:anti-sigma-K factor RskA
MNDTDAFDLIPAYALGALTDAERARVEALLATSAEARVELRAYQETMAGIAALTPLREAPAHLTDSFRQRLAASAAFNAAETMAVKRGLPPESPLQPIPATPTRSAGRLRLTPIRALIAVAAVIALVVGAVIGYRVVQDIARQQYINAILSRQDAQWLTLEAQPAATGGNVQLVSVPGEADAVLVAQLPSLPQDRQYQLWMRVEETSFSLAVFNTGQPQETLLIEVPEPGRTKDFAVGITVEPHGGSPGPTTPAIFRAQYQRAP